MLADRRPAVAPAPRGGGLELELDLLEDRLLRPRGDDGLGNPLDPHERSAPTPSLVADDRLERVDPVGAHVLAEAEEDHPVTGHPPQYRRPGRPSHPSTCASI